MKDYSNYILVLTFSINADCKFDIKIYDANDVKKWEVDIYSPYNNSPIDIKSTFKDIIPLYDTHCTVNIFFSQSRDKFHSFDINRFSKGGYAAVTKDDDSEKKSYIINYKGEIIKEFSSIQTIYNLIFLCTDADNKKSYILDGNTLEVIKEFDNIFIYDIQLTKGAIFDNDKNTDNYMIRCAEFDAQKISECLYLYITFNEETYDFPFDNLLKGTNIFKIDKNQYLYVNDGDNAYIRKIGDDTFKCNIYDEIYINKYEPYVVYDKVNIPDYINKDFYAVKHNGNTYSYIPLQITDNGVEEIDKPFVIKDFSGSIIEYIHGMPVTINKRHYICIYNPDKKKYNYYGNDGSRLFKSDIESPFCKIKDDIRYALHIVQNAYMFKQTKSRVNIINTDNGMLLDAKGFDKFCDYDNPSVKKLDTSDNIIELTFRHIDNDGLFYIDLKLESTESYNGIIVDMSNLFNITMEFIYPDGMFDDKIVHFEKESNELIAYTLIEQYSVTRHKMLNKVTVKLPDWIRKLPYMEYYIIRYDNLPYAKSKLTSVYKNIDFNDISKFKFGQYIAIEYTKNDERNTFIYDLYNKCQVSINWERDDVFQLFQVKPDYHYKYRSLYGFIMDVDN